MSPIGLSAIQKKKMYFCQMTKAKKKNYNIIREPKKSVRLETHNQRRNIINIQKTENSSIAAMRILLDGT